MCISPTLTAISGVPFSFNSIFFLCVCILYTIITTHPPPGTTTSNCSFDGNLRADDFLVLLRL